jgi:hypothetical protein
MDVAPQPVTAEGVRNPATKHDYGTTVVGHAHHPASVPGRETVEPLHQCGAVEMGYGPETEVSRLRQQDQLTVATGIGGDESVSDACFGAHDK